LTIVNKVSSNKTPARAQTLTCNGFVHSIWRKSDTARRIVLIRINKGKRCADAPGSNKVCYFGAERRGAYFAGSSTRLFKNSKLIE
jgi:hypothetical protein